MRWLMALMVIAVVAVGGLALAGQKYQVGIVQPFVGLTCRSLPSAEHIFETWKASNAEAAREVFQVYQVADECRFFNTYSAYFIEELGRTQTTNFQGEMQTVLLFSISPSQTSDIIDYLVTWESLLPDGDAI